MEDYYKVLGLKRGASLKEISAAYRSLALIYHPDKRNNSNSTSDNYRDNSSADEQFHRVKSAYQALQDPKIRAELDLQLIGQEERLLRDAQMSAQRRKLRDDLLRSEKEASESQNQRKMPVSATKEPASTKSVNVQNREACLKLKIKQRGGEQSNLLLEVIKEDLGAQLRQIHPLTSSTCVAEFLSPQEAFEALSRIQRNDIDLISDADWLDGKPPSSIIISTKKSNDKSTESSSAKSNESKSKFTKEFENSVLEKLRLKKLQQQK